MIGGHNMWKKIKATSGRRRGVSSLSIQKWGRIMWNKSAHAALGEPQFVELLIDGDNNRLGIRSTSNSDTSDDFEVKTSTNQNSWSINSKIALREVEMVVERAFRRDAQLDDDGVLFIDVSEIADHQKVKQSQNEGA